MRRQVLGCMNVTWVHRWSMQIGCTLRNEQRNAGLSFKESTNSLHQCCGLPLLHSRPTKAAVGTILHPPVPFVILIWQLSTAVGAAARRKHSRFWPAKCCPCTRWIHGRCRSIFGCRTHRWFCRMPTVRAVWGFGHPRINAGAVKHTPALQRRCIRDDAVQTNGALGAGHFYFLSDCRPVRKRSLRCLPEADSCCFDFFCRLSALCFSFVEQRAERRKWLKIVHV